MWINVFDFFISIYRLSDDRRLEAYVNTWRFYKRTRNLYKWAVPSLKAAKLNYVGAVLYNHTIIFSITINLLDSKRNLCAKC